MAEPKKHNAISTTGAIAGGIATGAALGVVAVVAIGFMMGGGLGAVAGGLFGGMVSAAVGGTIGGLVAGQNVAKENNKYDQVIGERQHGLQMEVAYARNMDAQMNDRLAQIAMLREAAAAEEKAKESGVKTPDHVANIVRTNAQQPAVAGGMSK